VNHRVLALALMLGALLAMPRVAVAQARVSLLQDVTVQGPVSGDVVVVGGDVLLRSDARVSGHVISVFGEVSSETGAQVDGQVVAVASLSGLSLHPVENGSWRTGAGFRGLAIGLWLLIVNLGLLLVPGMGRVAAHHPALVSGSALLLGGMVAVTVFAALLAALGLGPMAPAAVLAIVLVGFVLKALGLAALTARLGTCCLPGAAELPLTVRASLVLALLLFVRLIPLVGGAVWTLVSVAALGGGVLTVVELARLPKRLEAVPQSTSRH